MTRAITAITVTVTATPEQWEELDEDTLQEIDSIWEEEEVEIRVEDMVRQLLQKHDLTKNFTVKAY